MGGVGDMGETTVLLVEQINSVAEQAKELQDLSASFISGSSREEDSLRQRANSLHSTIQSLLSSITNSNLLPSHSIKVISLSHFHY